MTQASYDVVVIGEGISGLTAAKLLGEGGARVATFEALMYGGLILNVNDLHPGPDERRQSGSELTAGLMETNAELGVDSIQDPVVGLGRADSGIDVKTASSSYRARHVILAAGARLKKLNVPGEVEFEGRGVSQCADCDGPMNFDADIVVIGGGDSALQEALVLTQFGKKVHIVMRRDEFRARKELVDAVTDNPKIRVIKNASVTSIIGGKVVQGVKLAHSDGRSEQLPCSAVFPYVGIEPNTDFLPSEIERDADGLVVTDDALRTQWPEVWAVGALRSGYQGLIPNAIAEATRAAENILAALPK